MVPEDKGRLTKPVQAPAPAAPGLDPLAPAAPGLLLMYPLYLDPLPLDLLMMDTLHSDPYLLICW